MSNSSEEAIGIQIEDIDSKQCKTNQQQIKKAQLPRKHLTTPEIVQKSEPKLIKQIERSKLEKSGIDLES